MTVLSDGEIQTHIQNGKLGIVPFDATCLNGAGYDLRLGSELIIEPASQKLTSTFERVELPADLVGTLHIRSSLARRWDHRKSRAHRPGFSWPINDFTVQ